jgi:hypothetical protein
VGSEDDVFELGQVGVDGGFVLVDVEGGSGDLPAVEGLGQCGLVDKRYTGGVDEVGAWFHDLERVGVDKVMGSGVKGQCRVMTSAVASSSSNSMRRLGPSVFGPLRVWWTTFIPIDEARFATD